MASGTSTSLTDFQTMDESLEFIFSSMITQGEMLDAIEFLRSIEEQFLPSTKTMKTLIFEILMKCDNVRALAYTSGYLWSLLAVYPPINEERRKFYFDSVRSNHGFLADLWNIFREVVNSYFTHHRIYVVEDDEEANPIKFPNCKFVLHFYNKLFIVDFENYKSHKSTTCLVAKCFWPQSDIRTICLSNNTYSLLKWINDIYASAVLDSSNDLLNSLHEVLTLMVRCLIEERHDLTEYTAFSSPHLAELVDSIVNICKDAFSSLKNMRRCISFLTLNYLTAKLCEKVIKQIIKVSSRKYIVFTLKDIVDQCMFPSKLKYKANKYQVTEKRELRKTTVDKKYFTGMKMETTKLHELCKKKRFGDLIEELKSLADLDINARDPMGNTPLHEACSSGCQICIQHLIDAGSSGAAQTLDFAAFNLEGVTPLHIAVMNNFIGISKMLLLNGGPELLTMANNKGQVAADVSTSDSMNKLIQDFDSKIKDSAESDSSSESLSRENLGPAPLLKVFKDYSIYIDALQCLLCTYCHMFNLYPYSWNQSVKVSSHAEKKCCHFIGNDVCSEDAAIISEMPSLIKAFKESMTKNAAKHTLNIDIELIPLEGFSASIQLN